MALRNALLHISRKSVRNDTKARILPQFRTLYSSAVPEEATRAAAAADADAELKHSGLVKSLQEMPGPSAIGNLIEFFYRDGFSRIHEIQMEHSQKYGKIFKSRFGPQLVVSIADRDLVAQVLRAEGVAPQRANMESWKEYRDMRGHTTGLISA